MGNEQQNVDKEAQQTGQKVNNADNKDDQEVSRRMGRRMEMGDNGEDQHGQSKKSGHRVNDQDGR